MSDQPLITARPAKKEKGFRTSQLRIVPPTVEDAEVRRRLGGVLEADPEPLPVDRQRVIDLFITAYQRKLDGVALDPEHYVLAGHELVELDRIADLDVLRYLFYRYKRAARGGVFT